MSEEDVDPGERIVEIAALEEEPSHGFLGRIRNGILRRVAGVHALDFLFGAVFGFFREMGDLFFSSTKASSSRSRE
ncbi:MAG: hypothetical protein DHS20C21_03280 [Gemmatimonadota bacterium]|nr:MAG: hypothetical protein DHS20C21_03280 [Gemmatimonadota bacterium]